MEGLLVHHRSNIRFAQNTPDLTISIGSIGKYHLLERCLTSIFEDVDEALSIEVRVVYNGPGDDGVCEKIASDFPRVRVTRRSNSLGYCAAHNIVLNESTSRYVLVLDDDTVVSRGALRTMVAFMDAHPRVGLAGCKTLNADGSFQPTYGLDPSLRTEFMNIFKASSFMPRHLYREVDSVRKVNWLHGSFMFVRRETVREVGGFDERYYTYGCEADWCYRIRKAGWAVVYVPLAQIVHVGGEHSINTSHTAAKKYSYIVRWYANRFYFFYKHYGRFSLWALRPIMALQSATRVAYFSVLYVFAPERRPVATTRIRAFLYIIALSFSPKPYDVPASIFAPRGPE